ncbi:MAG: hypothetical protein ACE5E5_02305 [Phycisphaerae bacterium]
MSDEHAPTAMKPPDEPEMPQGDHPLEIAARRSIGPLSTQAEEIWHGHAQPCVTCGLLVLRDQRECDHCGQDLSDEMIQKMKEHAGPWYVLEHLRPFPGVSLDRIIRQIRRGVLMETSIVRGPATDYQWRFAIETPGLCRYFGKCWRCHRNVSESDTYCPNCLSYLAFEAPKPAAKTTPATESADTAPGGARTTPQLMELSAALNAADVVRQEPVFDEPPRIAGIRATWFAVALLVLVIAVLLWMTQDRSKKASKNTASAGVAAMRFTAAGSPDEMDFLPWAAGCSRAAPYACA